MSRITQAVVSRVVESLEPIVCPRELMGSQSLLSVTYGLFEAHLCGDDRSYCSLKCKNNMKYFAVGIKNLGAIFVTVFVVVVEVLADDPDLVGHLVVI